jgi:hypothetical protein
MALGIRRWVPFIKTGQGAVDEEHGKKEKRSCQSYSLKCV